MSVSRRLNRLENLLIVASSATAGALERAAAYRDERRDREARDCAAFSLLLATMPESWRDLVQQDYRDHGAYDLVSNLSRQVELLVARCFFRTMTGPLALPGPICEALHGQPATWLIPDCAGCGQWHPSSDSAGNRPIFDRCVSCNDHVGRAAYFHRHGRWPDPVVIPASVLAQARQFINDHERAGDA